MSAPHGQTHATNAAGRHEAPHPPLARRIAAWTTNSLVSLLILVVGLGFGRQVLRWWAWDRPSPTMDSPLVAGSQRLGDVAETHEVRFGASPWRLHRQTLSGDRATILGVLAARCAEVTAEAPVPPGVAEADEARLLRSLSANKPVVETETGWVYQLSDGLPMVVGIRRGPGQPVPGTAQTGSATGRRMVSWAMAVPAPDQGWTLFVFRWAGEDREGHGPCPAVPNPPETQPGLGLEAIRGARMLSFTGAWLPDAWKAFYDDWFGQHGFQASDPWRWSGTTWCRQFVSPRMGQAAYVYLARHPAGRGYGLVMTLAVEASEP